MGPKRSTVLRCLLVWAAAIVTMAVLLAPAEAQQRSRNSATPAAATAAGGTIANIRIEGAQRIEPETIRSYLILQPGDAWDAEKVDGSLKALFATGLFADVKLVREGSTLVVRLVENPIINRIAFEGNSKLADKDLNTEKDLHVSPSVPAYGEKRDAQKNPGKSHPTH